MEDIEPSILVFAKKNPQADRRPYQIFRLIHEVESVLSGMRNGQIVPNERDIEIFFKSNDVIHEFLAVLASHHSTDFDTDSIEALISTEIFRRCKGRT